MKVEKLAEQDGFFEGPVWHRGPGQGFLTFSDVTQNRVFKWDRASGLTTYIDNVFTGKDTSSVITFERNGKTYQQPGPNGQTLDKEGRLVFCAMGSGKIMRREANGSLTVLVVGLQRAAPERAERSRLQERRRALLHRHPRQQPHHG